MVFVGGPQQSGKTTLAKHLCSQAECAIEERYLNWDAVKDREQILSVENNDFVLLETLWVLEASCRVPRKEIADKLINILNLSGIVNVNR
jgi:hypothetical protein